MTVDPKYANLPGIAKDQPDVYETNDLPESDQAQKETQEEFESNDIEATRIAAQEAFQKFKGKHVEPIGTDFSDRLRRGRNLGYMSRTEYEIVDDKEQETVDQKYQRLLVEVAQLTEEINKCKDKVKSGDTSQGANNTVTTAQELNHLQHQLTELNLDMLQGETGKANLADPQGSFQKRLMQELVSFKPLSEGQGKAGGGAKQDDRVTYELFYRPDQAKFSSNARAAALEQRLERLEAVLGSNPEKLSVLSADTVNKGLVGAVAVLSSKLKVLDPVQVEHIDGRLLGVNQKLTEIIEKKEVQTNADKQNKISELYNMMKKWDGIADSLPQIRDRLVTLSGLHQQAVQFTQAVAYLDTAQKEIVTQLQSQQDVLQQVEKCLQDNMDTVKSAVESLDQRMKNLTTKK